MGFYDYTYYYYYYYFFLNCTYSTVISDKRFIYFIHLLKFNGYMTLQIVSELRVSFKFMILTVSKHTFPETQCIEVPVVNPICSNLGLVKG